MGRDEVKEQGDDGHEIMSAGYYVALHINTPSQQRSKVFYLNLKGNKELPYNGKGTFSIWKS